MLPAFDTPSGLPLSSIDLAKREGIPDHGSNGRVSTAEVSTLQLEFRYLSHLTDDDVYWRTVEKVCVYTCIIAHHSIECTRTGNVYHQAKYGNSQISLYIHGVRVSCAI